MTVPTTKLIAFFKGKIITRNDIYLELNSKNHLKSSSFQRIKLRTGDKKNKEKNLFFFGVIVYFYYHCLYLIPNMTFICIHL